LLVTPPTVTVTLPVVAPDGTATVIELELQLVAVAVVPLKLTALVPCADPRLVPRIITDVPTTPEVGETLVILGVGNTVNAIPLLLTPLAFTTTLPVVAPGGTVTAIDVALQLVTVAAVPLKVTLFVPWVEPKFAPVIVTDAPTGADVDDRLVILGDGINVKLTPLLARPLIVTTTFPELALAGTGTVIEVEVQLIGLAVVPLNVTVPVVPKLCPVMVTRVPAEPDVGDKLVMLGGGTTVNPKPLLLA